MMLKGDSLELDKGAAAPWCTSRAMLDQPLERRASGAGQEQAGARLVGARSAASEPASGKVKPPAVYARGQRGRLGEAVQELR